MLWFDALTCKWSWGVLTTHAEIPAIDSLSRLWFIYFMVLSLLDCRISHVEQLKTFKKPFFFSKLAECYQRKTDACPTVWVLHVKYILFLMNNRLSNNLERRLCLPMSKTAFGKWEGALIKVFLLPQLFKQNQWINFACFIDSWEPFHILNSHLLEYRFIFFRLQTNEEFYIIK